jgi:cytochrome c5
MARSSKKRTTRTHDGMPLAVRVPQVPQARLFHYQRIEERIQMNFASKAAAIAAVSGFALASGFAAAADGKAVYDKVCTVCHAAGVAGAPKFGDKAAWAPRVGQGKDALFQSVVKGKGAMPPKAGNADLKDDEIKAAIDYMVAAAK